MFNVKKHYMVPMSRLDTNESNEIYVECTIKPNYNHYVVEAIEDGYRLKRFYPEYLKYLYEKGYVKDIE